MSPLTKGTRKQLHVLDCNCIRYYPLQIYKAGGSYISHVETHMLSANQASEHTNRNSATKAHTSPLNLVVHL